MIRLDRDDILLNGVKPWAPEGEEYLPYQLSGITEMILRDNVILGDQPGLGKTIQAIGLINVLEPDNILYVVPNNLRLNTMNELIGYDDNGYSKEGWLAPHLREKYEIEMGTSSYMMPSDFMVVSYECLTRNYRTLVKMPWDLLIFDEAHMVKNRDAQRTKAFMAFIEHSAKKILMTGTPVVNFVDEIFNLIHFVSPEQWPSRVSFLSRYMPYGNRFGYHLEELQKLLREGRPKMVTKTVKRRRAGKTPTQSVSLLTCEDCGNEFSGQTDAHNHVTLTGHIVTVRRESRERIVPYEEVEVEERAEEPGVGILIRRTKSEVLKELPRKRRQIIEFPPEGELLALVNKEKDVWKKQIELQAELLKLLSGDDDVDADDENYMRAIEKLQTNNKYYFTELQIIRHQLGRAKVPYVIDHVENMLAQREKVVLMCWHNDVCEMFHEHFGQRSVLYYGPTSMPDRQAAERRFWNDEKCEVFICSMETGGQGINLQVSSLMVFAEFHWVPGKIFEQCEDRCHRIGQEKSLLVQHLIAEDSMDSHMVKRVVRKKRSMDRLLNRRKEA